MNKNWKILTAFSFSALIATLVWRGSQTGVQKKTWTVYEFIDKKSGDKTKVIARSPKKEELKKILAPTKAKKRAPASVEPPKFRGRKIYGLTSASKINPSYMDFSNSVKRDWKKKLTHQLIRFHEKETKLFVKEEISLIKVEQGKARYVEQVIISYVMPDKKQSSFRALVDSETGKVISTWDRTKQDVVNNIFKRKKGLSPSGIL